MRDLVAGGELGEITRISYFVTDWFRGWSYYASGGWRATWAGEGGGVLLNQCPHNLDLLQWIAGMMPRRITAVASHDDLLTTSPTYQKLYQLQFMDMPETQAQDPLLTALEPSLAKE